MVVTVVVGGAVWCVVVTVVEGGVVSWGTVVVVTHVGSVEPGMLVLEDVGPVSW